MTQYHLHLKGYVGGADFNTESVLATLAANPDAEVSVLVDSTGGQLATALSISSAFHRHGRSALVTLRSAKKVHVHFSGMNASAVAASVSVRTKAMRRIPKRRRIFSNIAPTEPMLSIRSTSVARNFPSMILIPSCPPASPKNSFFFSLFPRFSSKKDQIAVCLRLFNGGVNYC